jgi:hypothetical protein
MSGHDRPTRITSTIRAVSIDGTTTVQAGISGTREGVEGFVALLAKAGLTVIGRLDLHEGGNGKAPNASLLIPIEPAGPCGVVGHGLGCGCEDRVAGR